MWLLAFKMLSYHFFIHYCNTASYPKRLGTETILQRKLSLNFSSQHEQHYQGRVRWMEPFSSSSLVDAKDSESSRAKDKKNYICDTVAVRLLLSKIQFFVLLWMYVFADPGIKAVIYSPASGNTTLPTMGLPPLR